MVNLGCETLRSSKAVTTHSGPRSFGSGGRFGFR